MQPTPAASRTGTPAPARARLRSVPGAYDLDTAPLRIPTHKGESAASWLRRAGHRYQSPPAELLRFAGSRRRIASTRTARARLLNYPSHAHRLGLSSQDRQHLGRPDPVHDATRRYADTFHGLTITPPVGSRYCPHCLTGPDSYWSSSWEAALAVVCLRHGVALATTCPGCGRRPFASPVWLTGTGPIWTCPSRQPSPDSDGRTVHPWCGHDLRTTATLRVEPAALTGQRLLHDLASSPHRRRELAGLEVTHQIGFHAMAALIDTHLETTLCPSHYRLQTTKAPAPEVAAALAIAAQVLTAPTLAAAAAVLDEHGLLPTTDRHAPFAPPSAIRIRAHNPLLAAIQIRRHRRTITTAHQLALRTARPVPSFPTGPVSPAQAEYLCLPGSPRIDTSTTWIPAHPGPGTIPGSLRADMPSLDLDNPTTQALLALVMAKIGSLKPWRLLCLDLGLPTDLPTRLKTLWAHPQWPRLHRLLDHLVTRLQRDPPPVDYRTRRILGEDTTLLSDALTAAARRYPTITPGPVLLRRFWELFTGGHIQFAPQPLTLTSASPEHAAYRQAAHNADHDNQRLFAPAHAYITAARTLPVTGPLTWHPARAVHAPESTGPDAPEPHPLYVADRDGHILLRALLDAHDRTDITSNKPYPWMPDVIRAIPVAGAPVLAEQHTTTMALLYLPLAHDHPRHYQPPTFVTRRLQRCDPSYTPPTVPAPAEQSAPPTKRPPARSHKQRRSLQQHKATPPTSAPPTWTWPVPRIFFEAPKLPCTEHYELFISKRDADNAARHCNGSILVGRATPCPYRQACRDYAETNHETHGVWGGINFALRHKQGAR
ncbi:MAG: TniQ family protein [Actinomycetales bacterium]